MCLSGEGRYHQTAIPAAAKGVIAGSYRKKGISGVSVEAWQVLRSSKEGRGHGLTGQAQARDEGAHGVARGGPVPLGVGFVRRRVVAWEGQFVA